MGKSAFESTTFHSNGFRSYIHYSPFSHHTECVFGNLHFFLSLFLIPTLFTSIRRHQKSSKISIRNDFCVLRICRLFCFRSIPGMSSESSSVCRVGDRISLHVLLWGREMKERRKGYETLSPHEPPTTVR